jgi:hypothetical protein
VTHEQREHDRPAPRSRTDTARRRVTIEQEWRLRAATLSLSALLHEVGDYFVAVRYDDEVAERSYPVGAIRIALTAIAATAGTKTWREGPLPETSRAR